MGAVVEFVNPWLAALGGLSLPVKVAWGVWLVWGIGHLGWSCWPAGGSSVFRTTSTTTRQSGVRPVAVRPLSSSRVAVAPPAVAPYGTPDFLAALDQEQQPQHAGADVRHASDPNLASSAYR